MGKDMKLAFDEYDERFITGKLAPFSGCYGSGTLMSIAQVDTTWPRLTECVKTSIFVKSEFKANT